MRLSTDALLRRRGSIFLENPHAGPCVFCGRLAVQAVAASWCSCESITKHQGGLKLQSRQASGELTPILDK
ncbi:hypothetical protein WJX79_008540 [Trebouxia sp. C0005]